MIILSHLPYEVHSLQWFIYPQFPRLPGEAMFGIAHCDLACFANQGGVHQLLPRAFLQDERRIINGKYCNSLDWPL